MTHEIVVLAINPDFPEEAFQEGGIGHLEPLNHVAQFASKSDSRAIEVAVGMVERLVAGQEIAEPQGIMGATERFRKSVEDLAAE